MYEDSSGPPPFDRNNLTENKGEFSKMTTVIRSSVTFKVFAVGFLILVLLIPTAMVRNLIKERECRQDAVVEEIGAKWGTAQTISGPIITLPYEETVKTGDGKTTVYTRYFHILPDKLDVVGELSPEIRHRGLYETVLYNAKLRLTGLFLYPDLEEQGISRKDIIWSRAFLAMGISDMKGVKENVNIRIDGMDMAMNPGIETTDIFTSGIHVKLKTAGKKEKLSFDVSLDLNGSQYLYFVPAGKDTSVSLSSTWSSPSFDGSFLPAEREINEDGFNARWRVLHLNRNYPQCWKGNRYKIADSAFGVKFFVPNDAYQKSTRTAKYAVLFISLTFMVFFFAEIMNKLSIHPLQYLLIGLALTVFYTLLISISEHTGFGKGYALASIATILLITGYAKGVLRKNVLALVVGSVLTILYVYLYIVLQLENFALLLGSIGIFIILAVVMCLTRKINWYAIGTEE